MSRLRVLLTAVVVVSCAPPPSSSHPEVPVAPELYDAVAAGAPVRCLVELNEDEGQLQQGLNGDALPWTDDELLQHSARLEALKAKVRAAAPQVTEAVPLPNLPVLAVRVSSPAELDALAAAPGVRSVTADVAHEASLAESLPLIHQPAAATAGQTGAGTSVAVLDTGVDYTRAAFGSCSSAGGSCKVAFAKDFAPDDGALDAHGHGTNVAGIVLGVAPGAKVLALDVFSGGSAYSTDILAAIDWCIQNRTTYNIAAINMSLGSGGSATPCSSDVFASSITAAKRAGIVSAVASGNNGYTNLISSPACAPDAVSVGAVYDSNVGALGWSGCSDSVTGPDRVTCFSNSASFLTLLAPGALITAAGATMGGTSQATPHVAGALAVVAAAFPAETPQQRIDRLVGSGTSVTDPRTGRVTPRLDVAAATTRCAYTVTPGTEPLPAAGGTRTFSVATGAGCAWSITSTATWLTPPAGTAGTGPGTATVTVGPNPGATRTASLVVAGVPSSLSQEGDGTAPQGAVVIGTGAAAINVTAVTLSLPASDDVAVKTMCVSNTATCTSFVAYTATKTWTLAAGGGTKTVTAWFRDAAGNTSAAASASVLLDMAVPTNGTATAAWGDGKVDLAWQGFADALSGIASYRVVYAAKAAPSTCLTGAVAYEGTELATTVSGLTNGTTYGFRVCARDAAGNLSTGATATARPLPEMDAPVGTVLINGGAAYATSTSVKLTIGAADASGVSQMCLSNTATCTAWLPYATTATWSLAGAGTRSVSVRFKDVWGTVSAAVSDDVFVDLAAPTGGALTATISDAQVALAWSGFTDGTTGSGIEAYVVVAGLTTAPASCKVGTLLGRVAESAFTAAGLVNGTKVGFRVCAVDRAGNLSTGVTVVATPVPESDAPVGSVTINGGAEWTKTAAVTLSLPATDASGVASVCVSNTTTCTVWQAWAATLPWSLATGDGKKTVTVRFRDVWGFVSAPVTATIALDATTPTTGTLTATAGSQRVDLSWSGATDASSGVVGYRLVAAAGTVPPASCAVGTLLVAGVDTSFAHTGLAGNASYAYRLCPVDAAGNVSTGVTKVLKTLP